jgi:superfamily II DNA or RNA helicase
MINLRVEHHKVFIEEASKEELASVRKLLKIYNPLFNPPPGSPPFEILNLYYKEDKSFPSGYLNSVLSRGKKQGLEFKVKDLRTYPRPSLPFRADTEAEELWENQKEALDLIKQEQLGTVSSATGSGKTRLIEETILHRGVKTLVVVPYRLIQNQMATRLTKTFGRKHVSTKIPKATSLANPSSDFSYQKIGGNYSDLYNTADKDQRPTNGKKLGSSYSIEVNENVPKRKLGSSYAQEFYGDKQKSPEEEYFKKKGIDPKTGFKNLKIQNKKSKIKDKKNKIKKPNLGSNITVVCFNSLAEASLEFLQSIECVIIDECHHSSAITIREALDKMNKAAYRYGFSATPWRDKNADQKLLLAALGDKIIYDLQGEEAVSRGIIARPKYNVITSPTPDQWLRDDRNWRSIVEKGIVGNTSRNKSIINKAVDLFENNHNVFICVDEIAHLEILQKRFQELGIEVLTVHGEQNPKINNSNIKKIAQTTSGLISIGTMAVGEGTDMPNISAIILASGGKASIRFLQRIGRGTRLTNGKNEVIVIDFEDWFNPTLLKHSKERRKIFKKYFGDN